MMNRKTVIITTLLLSGILLTAGCSTKESSDASVLETPSTIEEPASTPLLEISPSAELPPSYFLPDIPRISVEEVKAKLDAGYNIVIVDSRPKTSYEQSHIVEAISIPLTDMAEPYGDLDGYDEIITYCT